MVKPRLSSVQLPAYYAEAKCDLRKNPTINIKGATPLGCCILAEHQSLSSVALLLPVLRGRKKYPLREAISSSPVKELPFPVNLELLRKAPHRG